MSDELDLRALDQRHEPDPEFRAALRRRVAAIVAGTERVASMTETDDAVTVDLTSSELSTPRRRRRRKRVGGGLLAVACTAAVVAALAVVSVGDDASTPADSAPGRLTSIVNGWVSFASYDDATADSDVYVVREGTPAQRVAGTDSDASFQVCPAFSPDGEQLLFGQAEGNPEDGFHDAVLVVAAMAVDGRASGTTTIELQGASLPPCAIWSADGRWVAFGMSTSGVDDVWDEVWVVGTDGGDDIRRLTGLAVADLDWAPDRPELAIASDGEIWIYSVTSDEQHLVGQVSDVQSVALSPDGDYIAFTRPGSGSPNQQDLWLMRRNGTDATVVASDARGIDDPLWSPDGDRIAYTRLCEEGANGLPCREDQEVVLVTVDDNDPVRPSGTQAVIPHPETVDAEGRSLWWHPESVTWSPDGMTLLYLGGPEWDGDPQDELLQGLVAAPMDAGTEPIVLHETENFSAYGGTPWRPLASWGRQPEG